MKQLFIATIAIAIFSGLLLSCNKEDSDDVNQDKIYTTYELFYNANTDKTVVIARLQFGDATGMLLEATDSASVTFNGDLLPYSYTYSGHSKEYAGKLTSGTFVYTNTDHDVFTNSVPTMDTVAYQNSFDTIFKSHANTFTWIGHSLSSTERVNLFVGSWVWGQDANFFAYGQGQTNIIMGLNQLNGLAEGNSTCYIDRSNEVNVTQGTSKGGVIRTRYRPVNKQIVVVP